MELNRRAARSAEDAPVSVSVPDWRSKYLAVLFETDRSRLSGLIRQAEQIILARECELFVNAEAQAEKAAINNALHSLHALRSCLGLESHDSSHIGWARRHTYEAA
jgi:hypothetical protein